MNALPLGRCSVRIGSNRCHRWAKVPCSHCFQPICFQHEQIHLNSNLKELKEKISSLNKDNFIRRANEKIQLWKTNQIESIESTSSEMFDKILQRVERIDFDEIRSNLLQQIDSNLFEISENHLENIQNQINEIYRSIDISSDGKMFVSSTNELKRFEKEFLSIRQVSHCYGPMCGGESDNDYLILFQSQPDYSLLLFHSNEFLHRISIDHCVNDIVWSKQRQIFLILTDSFLFEFDVEIRRLSSPSKLNSSDRQIYRSLTSNSTNLFLLQIPDLTIHCRDLFSPYSIKDQFEKFEFFDEKTDRTIGLIRSSNENLIGMTIEQSNYQWRFDLFNLHRFERIYRSLPFGQTNEIQRGFCHLIPSINHSHHWFIFYSIGEQNRLVLVDPINNKFIDEIDRKIFNLTTIKSDQFVLLDSKSIQFYSN